MNDRAAIEIERDGYAAHLVIAQPARRNAVNRAMWEAMASALAELASDDTVRIVVVTGAGEQAFSAGADISEFGELRTSPDAARAYNRLTHAALESLGRFPKPTIARILGACIGGGMEIALSCDIRVAGEGARFAVTPARLGLGYNLDDTQLLVDRLGAPATREILFTGRVFDPAEALRLGIVSRVAPAGGLDAMVADYVSDIAANAPLTVKASKSIIGEAVRPPAERDTALCDALVAACYASEDFLEGQAAFAQKRKPRFTGR